MIINMYKSMTSKGFVYKFSNMNKGYANITMGILYRRISLYSQEDKLILSSVQYDFMSKLISIAPFLQIKTVLFTTEKCPFNIYDKDGNLTGNIKVTPHNYSAYIAQSDFSSDVLKFKSILTYG